MSKIIAIFCDGTWNNQSLVIPTHVYACAKDCAQTEAQMVTYFSGVGARERPSWAATQFWKYGGGIFGWGLNQRILEAYTHVVENYEPGDKLMVFGFSRGAYTARSLVGMIRKCGIMERSKLAPFSLKSAFSLYRKRGEENHPDARHILKERRRISPRFATSETDLEARTEEAHIVDIAYLGVWDTVGALGIPVSVFGGVATLVNWRHQFHDTELSSLVKSARHAVAIDERRKMFIPALWSNLGPHTDADGEEREGLNGDKQGPDRPFQQIWFIGNHAVVGGSSNMNGLTAISRNWIMEGAIAQGLALKEGVEKSEENPVQGGYVDPPRALYQVVPSLIEWRRGLADEADLHPSADTRMDQDAKYRPQSLRMVRPYKVSPV